MSDIDAVTGLVSPCLLCGVVPSIDYLVDDGYWQDTVPSHLRAGVICLPCLVERAGTVAFEHVRLIYLTVGGTTRAFGGAGTRIKELEDDAESFRSEVSGLMLEGGQTTQDVWDRFAELGVEHQRYGKWWRGAALRGEEKP